MSRLRIRKSWQVYNHVNTIQGLSLSKKLWGQLAPKFSDLVTGKSISKVLLSKKCEKLVTSEKN